MTYTPPSKFVTGRIIGNATEPIADPTQPLSPLWETPRSDEAYILRLLGRIADLERELRQAQERIEILTGTLERARSYIENRGAFRSHTLMLEMIDTALNDAAASGPKEPE